MLRALKLMTLRGAHWLGVHSLLMRTGWRRQRVLILCYHGISLDDEHLWNPDFYMPRERLRERLQTLKEQRVNVISLDEAVRALYAQALPERSVVLTFDDGTSDFYRLAYPLLKEFQFPATVYLTTYYSVFNHPVFDVMLPYLLWKGRGRPLDFPAALPERVMLDERGRVEAEDHIKKFARREKLSAQAKDLLLLRLAQRLHVDYADLCARRILHVMTPDEVAAVAAGGIDIQLHTHRHRVSIHRDKFLREINENRACMARYAVGPLHHFCYPGGFHVPQFSDYLAEGGVISATTCEPGLASRRTDPFLLPRLVDHINLTPMEFTGWISGLSAMLPRRAHIMSEAQLMEGPAA